MTSLSYCDYVRMSRSNYDRPLTVLSWIDHRSLALITASPTYGKLSASMFKKNEEFVIVSGLC